MTTFVILAAGRGTRIGRVGEHLHKALVPLGGRAVLSHLIDLAPPGADIVVCTGHRADQISAYLHLAHPGRKIQCVYVDGWGAGGVGGPGWSLLASKPFVKGDLVFTSCDTLWGKDTVDWGLEGSWLGVAPVPANTPLERWCRVVPGKGRDAGVTVLDKVSEPSGGAVHTGMGRISADALPSFWAGLESGATVQGERQMSAGFGAVKPMGLVALQDWVDVGDAEAYERAVEVFTGYDWSKTEEATYVLPEEGRVIKFHADLRTSLTYAMRGQMLADSGAATRVLDRQPGWVATEYVTGAHAVPMPDILDWASDHLWRRRFVSRPGSVATRFYKSKTTARVKMLPDDLRIEAEAAISPIAWGKVGAGVRPGVIHGDLTRGNLLLTEKGITTFDWRPDFGGHTSWGDIRYDLAKLWSGGHMDWETARHGDFRLPERGLDDCTYIEQFASKNGMHSIPLLGALCLLNSAPLHPSPMQEILVSRAVRLLGQFAV